MYRVVNKREIVSKVNLIEISAKEVAEKIQSNDLKVLTDRRSCQVEEHIPQKDGMHIYLSVKFPIYEESGTPRICGISTDITDVKKAQNQLRRLSGAIMAGQEKERSVIARELHDELGQVLTALHMDSVWIQNRLQSIDPKSSTRAQNMRSLIDNTIEEVRSLATRLRPSLLDSLGLVDALALLLLYEICNLAQGIEVVRVQFVVIDLDFVRFFEKCHQCQDSGRIDKPQFQKRIIYTGSIFLIAEKKILYDKIFYRFFNVSHCFLISQPVL